MTATPRSLADAHLYGVYLRPDPATCWAVTSVTSALRAQFGLVSAGAFPPHATLAGSLHVHAGENVLIDALDVGLAGRRPFPVHNAGPVRLGDGVVYDVNHRPDGSVNADFHALAAAVDRIVSPLIHPEPVNGAARYSAGTWRAHLSLASHDLIDRSDLRDEVQDYIAGLPIETPTTFAGDTVTLYRTGSADWSGRWWETLSWTHLHTWRLTSA